MHVNQSMSTNSESVAGAANRLGNRFEKVTRENRAALITFITAGDPNIKTSSNILTGLAAAGADIIELGMPFSDPMADGPAIQLSYLRALKNHITLQKTIDMVQKFRANNSTTPLILMGYYNPIYRYGRHRFITDALAAGVDGLIIVDLPPEQDDELCDLCFTRGLHWIRLTTPTTVGRRLTKVIARTSGFIYHISIAGITGTKSAAATVIQQAVDQIRMHTELPIAVGFGIKTVDQVKAAAQFAEGVVVGSAIVEKIAAAIAAKKNEDKIVKDVHAFVGQLAAGLTRGD